MYLAVLCAYIEHLPNTQIYAYIIIVW